MLVAIGELVSLPTGNPGSAPDYRKYLDQSLMVLLATFTSMSKKGRFLFEFLVSFAGNLHNKACFCETIETRGCNPMFQLDLHTPKYLDQFLMVLLETFTIGLISAR